MESRNFDIDHKRPGPAGVALDEVGTEKKNKKKIIIVRYKECLKNHAAAIGGNARDGCGEFMAAGEEGTPDSLKCSACTCHRNFHRKHLEPPSSQSHYHYKYDHYPPNSSSKSNPCGHECDDDEARGGDGGRVMMRKRVRTKFSEEQKEKMLRFAEKAGWKMHKVEESVVQQFCQEVGIKRRVLKVWMHNNKNTFANRNLVTTT